HAQRRPPAGGAVGFDATAVQTHQLVYQRQSDATALLGAPRRTLHAVETLEPARHPGCGDPDAGVGTLEPGAGTLGPQPHGTAPLQRELEGVGDRVEDYLLPHVAVDEARGVQVLALDQQTQAGALHRRAEHAGEITRADREIGRLEGGLGASRLN